MIVNAINKVFDKTLVPVYNKILPVIANNSCTQRSVKWAVKNDNIKILRKHLPPLIGLWVGGFYIYDTLKSKKIEKERKTTLAINFAINTIFGIIGGYALNGAIFRLKNRLMPRFEKSIVNEPDAKVLKEGLDNVIPLFAFTFVLRYIAPVIATPLADWTNKFLIKHGYIKDPNGQKPKTATLNRVG